MWCWRICRLKNYQHRNKLVDKLVKERSENIDGNEMTYNKTLNYHKSVSNSSTIYIVLIAITFVMTISISSDFLYFHWNLKVILTLPVLININSNFLVI